MSKFSGGRSPDNRVREERRRPPRVPGRGRRTAGPRADRELGAPRRGVLGDPGAGPPAATAGGHRAPDHLRPAGHRPVRSGAARSTPRPRDPGRRRLRGDGCRRLEQAAILGFAEGGPLALLLAASFPRAMSRARAVQHRRPHDAPRPTTRGELPRRCCSRSFERQADSWAAGDTDHLARLAPSRADDARFAEQIMPPRARRGLTRRGGPLLPAVGADRRPRAAPDRPGPDPGAPAGSAIRSRQPELGRYVADHIPDAKYVELDGADHLWFTENADELVDEIEEFLTGARSRGRSRPKARDGPLHRHRRLHRAGRRAR